LARFKKNYIDNMDINVREKLIRFLGYILASIFFLGFIILYVGLDGNLLFVGIGILILLPFVIWFLILNLKEKKLNTEEKAEIQKLKKYGEKIIVNLENVKINSNSWKQEVRKTSRYEDEVSHVDINLNSIEIKIPYRSEFINYSIHINMETTKLKMHFAIKRETILYVDLKDKNKNYLDLEFLN
jgi:Mn2+/Fe2+ NRAMP family transporter